MILKRTVLKGGHAPFVMELPPYRLPTVKTLWMHLYERVKDFAVRAGTILLGASIVIWFLRSFSFAGGFHMLTADQAGDSLLASAGKLIAPLFIPLGFGFWQASVALVAGLVAKEAVVGTLSILYNNATDAGHVRRAAECFHPGGGALLPGVRVAVYALRGGLFRHTPGDEFLEMGGGHGGLPDRSGMGGFLCGVSVHPVSGESGRPVLIHSVKQILAPRGYAVRTKGYYLSKGDFHRLMIF